MIRKITNKGSGKWELYARRPYPHEKEYRMYAWVNPEGRVCFNRDIAPLGWATGTPNLLVGLHKLDLKSDGWRKVKTAMTQEQLAQGWLC